MALRRLSYIFIPVLAILLMSHNVFAEQYGSAARYPIKSCVMYVNGKPEYRQGTVSNQTCRMTQDSQYGSLPGEIESMSIVFNSTIPANSFISLEFTFFGMNTYYGLTPQGNQTIIREDFERYPDNYSAFHVSVTIYTSVATNNLAFGAPIGYVNGVADVRVHDANVVLLFAPITGDQISQLQQKLNSIDANIVIADERLMYIYNVLNQQKSEMSELNDSVQERNDKEYESVDNIDNQTTDDIDAGDNTNMVNFLGQISGLFTQIRDIPASSECVITGDFGNLDIGNINFCTGKEKMPFVVNFFSFIFVTLVSLGLAFYLVNRVLSLYSWARSSSS